MTRRGRTSLVVLGVVLASACSAGDAGDQAAPDLNTEVSVCIGTSAGYEDGELADVEVESGGKVVASASLEVPGRVVLSIAPSTPSPRLLVSGQEWASSPRGGGWGVGTGDDC